MKNWWVPGLAIGYEHSFVHAVADFLKGLETGQKVQPDFRDALATQRVCEAVGYAHSCHIIHRDLKPENVMVGAFGETLVLDWGLARIVGDCKLARPMTIAVESSLRPATTWSIAHSKAPISTK